MADELTYAARCANTRSPELEMLLHCAGGDAGVAGGEGVRVSDWGALADAAEYHGLAPALYRTTNRACPELVPENVAHRLRARYRESAKRNLIFTSKLLSLLDVFESEGVAVVPLKGPILAESLYPDPALRPCSDLDLLVHKKDVPAALQLLTREGYGLGAHLARLSLRTLLSLRAELLLSQEQMVPVDLQWEVSPADFPFCFDAQLLWRSLSRSRIAGREVPSLSPEVQMLFLCVHGAKHMWSRLLWLGDIARLAGSQLDWVCTLELATEAQCERPLLLGLLLAHELLDVPVPEEILEGARGTKVILQLTQEIASRLTRIPPAEPEILEITTFNVRLAERNWKKVRHYAALLKAPTDVELQLLSLPEHLFFLYYPVRVAQLAWKYGLRLIRG
jgi:hypothetical protein